MIEVKVPSVGESVSEGVLAQWSVSDGQFVNKGDTLYELETDKATTEVPAPESGIVHHKAQAGDDVTIGAVVAEIDPDGKPQEDKKEAPDKPSGKEDSKTEKEDAQEPSGDKPRRAEPEIKEAGEERKRESDEEGERIFATSVARKIAEENSINLSSLKGTGTGGRITREDVEKEVERKANGKDSAPSTSVPPQPPKVSTKLPEEEVTRERMSTLRRRIAQRLVEAQQNAAMLTTFNDVDMSAVMSLRKEYKDSFKEKHGVGLGFMSFFVKAAIEGLKEFPRINAIIDGNDIVYHHRYHVGVAVSTEKGLVVPVIRDANQLSFSEIEGTIRDYAAKARDGKIDLDDLQGGTFTITNGGVFGSLLSTPILNPPQSGILGMHRIEERAVVVDGQVVARPMMYLALSYDHRIVDGREAVSFLARVKECIENPARMLLEI